MFGWLRSRRRERIRARPFPQNWLDHIERNVPYYSILSEALREELCHTVQILLDEKVFEGCNGFRISDEVRVTIAGHASILLLNRETDYYPLLKTVLVYPGQFWVEMEDMTDAGTVVSYEDLHAGESWDRGVIILAWDDVERATRSRDRGYNVVLHEFAHQLDQEDGITDGAPGFSTWTEYNEWAEVMSKHYDKLVRQAAQGRRTLIDPYGASDPAEFFAVVTETFFEEPVQLRLRSPELYNALKEYYRQDPAVWFEARPD